MADPKIAALIAAMESCACGRNVVFMEVCGTHTVSLYRSGIRGLLPKWVRLISGPGCPVCVSHQNDLERAIAAASIPGVTVAAYGDMLRVPGRSGSLLDARSRGADVRVVTCSADALACARAEKNREVVFLSVGFETTTPGTAATVLEAAREGIENFSIITLNKTVPAALRALLPDNPTIDGFLLPGHVCAVTGLAPYDFVPRKHGVACCVAGFEPTDMLAGIGELIRQVKTAQPQVSNMYGRVVKNTGNPKAAATADRVFVQSDAMWRGLGSIPASGLTLRPEFSRFDGLVKFASHMPSTEEKDENNECLCGLILTGRASPRDCPAFGSTCTPASPLGPCMVSTEGGCAASYKYGKGDGMKWE